MSNLAPEHRRAGLIALLLFVCMFLPWYTRNTDTLVKDQTATTSTKLTAFQSFSWVEAAVLLVAVAVIALLYVRGQRRPFHLPGGDGLIVAAGGAWVSALVLYRFVDNKQSIQKIGSNVVGVDYGITWGIFVTLFVGIALVFAGMRLRAAQIAEPLNPTAIDPYGDDRAARPTADRRSARSGDRPSTPAADRPPPRPRAKPPGRAPRDDDDTTWSEDERTRITKRARAVDPLRYEDDPRP